MEKHQFVALMDEKLKLIRTEYELTQDKMASLLGLSKKTIIEIEKKRVSLGWTGSVALASIFSDSTVLRGALGGDISGMIIAIAFKNVAVEYPKTAGGKVWWRTISDTAGYRIQQNLLSRHFRLLDSDNRRLFASFDLAQLEAVREDVIQS